jgi:hypothetical protein
VERAEQYRGLYRWGRNNNDERITVEEINDPDPFPRPISMPIHEYRRFGIQPPYEELPSGEEYRSKEAEQLPPHDDSIPCPFIYKNGRKCKGHIVEIGLFCWGRCHYHLYCSAKGNHAGIQPDDPRMKFYLDQLPEQIRENILDPNPFPDDVKAAWWRFSAQFGKWALLLTNNNKGRPIAEE